MLASARKDGPQVTSEWQKLHESIDGVTIREVLHVPRDHGVITEAYRPEWDPSGLPVVHIYQSRLFPGAIGAWSCHAKTIDRLFMKDTAISGPIEKRSRNVIPIPGRRGGRIWTKRPNKVHPTLAKGVAASVKVTPQAVKDLKSVEDFIQVG